MDEDGVHVGLSILYPKPYPIYFRGTIDTHTYRHIGCPIMTLLQLGGGGPPDRHHSRDN